MTRETDPAAQEHPAARAARTGELVAGLEPYALFCAYHLGLTDEGTYRFQNVHDVARRFGVGIDEVHYALKVYGLDSDTLVNLDFDLAGAQADIQVSPPGVDLEGLAEMNYERLLASYGTRRDWDAELEEAAAANAATFDERD